MLIWTSGHGTIHRDDWLENLIKGNSVEGLKQWVYSENKQHVCISCSSSNNTEPRTYFRVAGKMTVACSWLAFILRHWILTVGKSSRNSLSHIALKMEETTCEECGWPLGPERSLRLKASKETDHKEPSPASNKHELGSRYLRKKLSLANTLIPSLWFPVQRTQTTVPDF